MNALQAVGLLVVDLMGVAFSVWATLRDYNWIRDILGGKEDNSGIPLWIVDAPVFASSRIARRMVVAPLVFLMMLMVGSGLILAHDSVRITRVLYLTEVKPDWSLIRPVEPTPSSTVEVTP